MNKEVFDGASDRNDPKSGRRFRSALYRLSASAPTGSGKTTTLAVMLNELNLMQQIHIISLEDPIEFLHPHKRAAFHQRELGKDFVNFASGAARRVTPSAESDFGRRNSRSYTKMHEGQFNRHSVPKRPPCCTDSLLGEMLTEAGRDLFERQDFTCRVQFDGRLGHAVNHTTGAVLRDGQCITVA
jgi:hypothetical protein